MKIRFTSHSLRGFVLMILTLFCSMGLYAQRITLKGSVTDGTGEAIIGASILEIGTTNGTITDVDGNFLLEVEKNAKLQVSYIGFQTLIVPVEGKSTLKIVLKESAIALEEVVAIGYGSQKKKEVTGSVSSVKAEDFNSGVKSSPMGLLQGKVAGLNISRSSGGDPTNTGYNIQIRGFSTLDKGAGTSPLYIVDGIPTDNIANIAPEEIASMDVLKDGSAAAIYGTRGTNGVILITTKRGNTIPGGDSFTTNVEYSGYVSMSTERGHTGMATPSEFVKLEQLSGGKVKPVIYDNGKYSTDWMAAVTRVAPISHNHNLSVSGAGKNFSYRGSMAYKNSQGIAQNSARDEIIAKLAANQKALNGYLELQYDVSYMHYKNQYFCGDFKQAAILNPTYPIYDSSTLSGFFIPSGSGQSNPVAAMKQKQSYQDGNFFRGSVRATVNILPGLKLNGFAALEEGDNYNYWSNELKYDSDLDAAGRAGRKPDRNWSNLYEATLDYAGSWGGHSLTALLGMSYQKFSYDGMDVSNGGFPTDDSQYYRLQDGEADKSKLSVSSYRSSNTLASMFARANYNYQDKYLFSASIRREGSSRFGANNKWGYFPAASAGWRISGEEFMRHVSWINDLKLRFGFGVTGNNLAKDLASKELLTSEGTFWLDGKWVTTYKVGQNANPDLKWERKFEYNLGLDFSLINSRLYGTIEGYYRHTKDLLWEYNVPTPPYQYPTLLANAGEMVSKGLELTLTGVPVKTKDWEWSSTLTMAFNNNKITKLSDPSKGFNYTETTTGSVGENGIQGANTQIIVEGQPVGVFWGYKVSGVTTNGTLVYEKDENGKDKKQVVGNAQPLFSYGWNNTIRYKNWDLTLFFRGVYGNDVLNVTRWAYGPQKSQSMNVFMKDVNALANGTGAYRQGVFSDYYLEDGSYLKLDNVTLGYNMNVKPNKYLQSLRVFVTGENLMTITKYSGLDPEVNTSSVWDPGIDYPTFYPSIANFLLGVTITLK